ncbi:NUDIX hydrolase [Robiginitalea sp. IMCC44478]|uniref:NUDIX hydrolase n=1 Tax=Robiginitalea sp. IMCC44478 TaxID=3459122 RepID=UPI004041DAF8
MDERIDIWNKNGTPTGKSTLKSEAHLKGLFHPTVHIWIYNGRGQVLLQKRSETKKTFPGLWDVSVAGHVAAGEAIEEAALREAKEELGLEMHIADLYFYRIFKSVQEHSNGIRDCEFHHCYLSRLDLPVEAFQLQASEVAEVRWESLIAFADKVWGLSMSQAYVPHERSYYGSVIKQIRSML